MVIGAQVKGSAWKGPGGKRGPWRVLAASTALNAPIGSLYAFSVFLQPLEALLGLTRADLAFVFALAAAGFGVGMMLAPTLYGVASTTTTREKPWRIAKTPYRKRSALGAARTTTVSWRSMWS